MLLLLLACVPSEPADTDSPPRERPWSAGLPALEGHQRVITHLHSPWSHDACDGDGLVDGVVDEACLADLRAGLCTAGIDVAFLSDHPSHAAEPAFDDLFHPREGDVRDGAASVIPCPDGRTVRWLNGFEGELMPLGLDAHVPGDVETRHAVYGSDADDAVAAFVTAGAQVFQAHTEGKDPATLERLQDAGLTGVEIWNLHAMFDPGIRVDHLGLDALGWASAIAPFTSPTGTAEPDLFVLAVLERQAPSLTRFDALLSRGPMVGIVGTDAHQNVLPILLRDGERGDGYRRTLRWMSNHVLADGPEAVEAALGLGRSLVVFEILGTPRGFRFEASDGTVLGGTTTARSLEVDCPELHPDSPRGPDDPELSVRLLRDGQPFATGCGRFDVTPGVYRVEVDVVPHHLRPFLGEDPEPWIRSTPWILTNAIRVE